MSRYRPLREGEGSRSENLVSLEQLLTHAQDEHNVLGTRLLPRILESAAQLDEPDLSALLRLVRYAQEHLEGEDGSVAIQELGMFALNRFRPISQLEDSLRYMMDNLAGLAPQTVFHLIQSHLMRNREFETSQFNRFFVDTYLGFFRRFNGRLVAQGVMQERYGYEIFEAILENPNIAEFGLTTDLADGLAAFSLAIRESIGPQDTPEGRQRRFILDNFLTGISLEDFDTGQLNERNARRFGRLLDFLSSFDQFDASREHARERIRRICYSPLYLRRMFDIPDLYDRGSVFAERIGQAGDMDPMIFAELGWAIDTFGMEVTEALYNETGLVHFSRYPESMIREAYENLDPDHRREMPLLVMIYPYADYNGAFYENNDRLEPLIRGYRVIVAETQSEDGFLRRLSDIHAKHGDIDTIIIAGHGGPYATMFGWGADESAYIDVTDSEILGRLGDMVSTNIIFNSCSTGSSYRGIAARVSEETGVRTFAPAENSKGAIFELDDDGAIQHVQYIHGRNRLELSGRIFRGAVPSRR